MASSSFKIFGLMGGTMIFLMFVIPVVVIAITARFAVYPAIIMGSQRRRLTAKGQPELRMWSKCRKPGWSSIKFRKCVSSWIFSRPATLHGGSRRSSWWTCGPCPAPAICSMSWLIH